MSWLRYIPEENLTHVLRVSVLTYARHIKTGHSIKASMYEVIKDLKVPTHTVWAARKLLWEYATKKNKLSRLVNLILSGGSLEHEKRFLLELFADQIVLTGCDRAYAGKLANICRKVFGKEWMQPLEGLVGRLFALRYEVVWPSEENTESLSLEYGHPKWYVEYLVKILGRDGALRLMKASNEPPVTYVLLNTLKAREEEILNILEGYGIMLERDKRAPLLYRIETGRPDKILAAQKKGLISIQDYSSIFAVLALQPKSGMSILDVCAAPGVKTAILAIYTQNSAKILSLDKSVDRFATYTKRVKLLNVNCAHPIACDATSDLPIRATGATDAVLVDPSCSSTGLFWREPSYRWIVKPSSITRFSETQLKMLETASDYVKVNGYLLYCTCSVTVEENEGVISKFLSSKQNFRLVRPQVNGGNPGLLDLEECIRLYPHTDECSGFFAALMKRVG